MFDTISVIIIMVLLIEILLQLRILFNGFNVYTNGFTVKKKRFRDVQIIIRCPDLIC